jgi:hypothetical protein
LSEEREQQKVAYLRRSYAAVDGLWFVKLEEELGFERALEYDRRVWAIVPKLQARKAKELTGGATGLDDLRRGLELCFEAEEYQADLKQGPGELAVSVAGCPWVEALRRSERLPLAVTIAQAICVPMFERWAQEYGVGCQMQELACEQGRCRLRFSAP